MPKTRSQSKTATAAVQPTREETTTALKNTPVFSAAASNDNLVSAIPLPMSCQESPVVLSTKASVSSISKSVKSARSNSTERDRIVADLELQAELAAIEAGSSHKSRQSESRELGSQRVEKWLAHSLNITGRVNRDNRTCSLVSREVEESSLSDIELQPLLRSVPTPPPPATAGEGVPITRPVPCCASATRPVPVCSPPAIVAPAEHDTHAANIGTRSQKYNCYCYKNKKFDNNLDTQFNQLANAIVKLGKNSTKVCDICKDGRVADWFLFKKSYDQSKTHFTPTENVTRLSTALSGAAKDAVAVRLIAEDNLKKKWKNLKDGYRKELKKVPTFRSGSEGSDYQSQWKYFEQLSFLKDEYMPTMGASNLIIEEDTEVSQATEDEPSPSSLHSSPPPPSVSPVPSTSTSSLPPTPHLSGQQIPPQATTPREKETQNSSRKPLKATEIRAEYLEIEKKKLKLMEADLAGGKEKDIPRSDDYHFLMSLLPEMEKLNVLQKMRLRNKFTQALMDEISMNQYTGVTGYQGYFTQPPPSDYGTHNINNLN
ncbi:hypothetical protein ACJJTC_009681 [Scirpophaga incertulas]